MKIDYTNVTDVTKNAFNQNDALQLYVSPTVVINMPKNKENDFI